MNRTLLKDKCPITYPNKTLKRDEEDGLSHQLRLANHQKAFDDYFSVGIAQ